MNDHLMMPRSITRAWGMCLGVVGIHAPKLVGEPTGGILLDYPGGLVMVVFYNVFLLLFMFVVITRLVAGHWIVPFALIIIIIIIKLFIDRR